MSVIRSETPFPAERWFYIFLLIHLLCWTLGPALIRYNLPLDAIEGTIWGNQLEWGYDKNPYLNGWLTALANHLCSSDWIIYFFSQLSVVACFWAVWQLAKKMLNPMYALVAVLLLEGIQYYNFHAIDFNDNTLELGLWALAAYAFYQALKNNQSHAWILTGLWCGLGLMAKYYTLALLVGMFLLFVSDKNYRRYLTSLPPYLGLLTFVIVILPHVVWLFFHHFITVTYVFARASSPPSWTNHFFFATQFAWQQFEAFLPGLILFLLLLLGKKPRRTFSPLLKNEDRLFLLFVGVGPFLLTLGLSILGGVNLRAGWGMPLLSLWGILLTAWVQPRLSPQKLHAFMMAIFCTMSLLVGGYCLYPIYNAATSANYPGQTIAATITKAWHDQFHTKLDYVAGSRWVGGNIEFYSSDHPSVFIEWNPQHAPWINHHAINEKGAVFIWEISSHESLPSEVQKQFPRLGKPIVLEFAWQRSTHETTPVKIGMAILPPQHVEAG